MESKIVSIGGGSGSSVALRGLKQHTSALTAIVTMFDSGGSSGKLREEFGYPPVGDLRQCLVALSEEEESTEALRTLVEFRFLQDSSLNGHSMGNLLLAALTTLRNDVEAAIEEMSRILRIQGHVVPVTLERADLCAELEDGSIVREESAIDLRGKQLPRIRRIFLDPPVVANPRAIQAILEADAIVLGPGDLYTSIIPNLLARGIPEALQETKATRIYICNLMTKLGETDGFKASDFVREIVLYMGDVQLDWTVANTRPIPAEIQQSYVAEAAYPVEPDAEAVQKYGAKFFGGPLANNQQPLRHDSSRLAEAILSVIGCGRHVNGNGNGLELDALAAHNYIATSVRPAPAIKETRVS
ncbi:MAG: gluconeogenesis factor YvcK family protein [Chloroflexota bacterium]